MTMSQAGQAGKDVTTVQIEMHSVSLNVASVRKNKHSAPGAQKFKNRFNLCDLTRLKPLTF